MPAPVLQSLIKGTSVSMDKAEEFWKKAKEQYGEDYEKVVGTVKVMIKNYEKSVKESVEVYKQKSYVDLVDG